MALVKLDVLGDNAMKYRSENKYNQMSVPMIGTFIEIYPKIDVVESESFRGTPIRYRVMRVTQHLQLDPHGQYEERFIATLKKAP